VVQREHVTTHTHPPPRMGRSTTSAQRGGVLLLTKVTQTTRMTISSMAMVTTRSEATATARQASGGEAVSSRSVLEVPCHKAQSRKYCILAHPPTRVPVEVRAQTRLANVPAHGLSGAGSVSSKIALGIVGARARNHAKLIQESASAKHPHGGTNASISGALRTATAPVVNAIGMTASASARWGTQGQLASRPRGALPKKNSTRIQ